MSSQIKPLYQIELKLQYKRHLERLASIGKQRSRRILEKDSLTKMHKIRNQSMHFQAQKHTDMLNQENDKIINKLLHIARRKSTSMFQAEPPKIKNFNNPARKRQQRKIIEDNYALAERILAKQSQFDSINQRKNIEEYEKVKKMMENNKKVSLPQLDLSRAKSLERLKDE